MPSIEILPAIAPTGAAKACWLVDIWGVLHNGVAAFPSAIHALRTYRNQRGHVLLISNAPRPAARVAEQLIKLGVPNDAYDGIITSGDVTRGLLEKAGAVPALHIGPARDLGIYDGLALTLSAEADAQLIVCTGLFDDTNETAENYRVQLSRLAVRQAPMLCANPDLMVERGNQIIPCAGAIAALYETLGGAVTYAGKPHAPIYTAALHRVAQSIGRHPQPSEVLCIGDGLLTDIKGAHAQGLPMLFIASGVHVADGLTTEALDQLFATTPYRPMGAQAVLTW